MPHDIDYVCLSKTDVRFWCKGIEFQQESVTCKYISFGNIDNKLCDLTKNIFVYFFTL